MGLAAFKFPERLRVVDQLPRNSIGKVVQRDLAQLADAPAGHEVT